MSALRRCCLALLLVVSTGTSLAQASPIDIGVVSVFDRPGFGPSVTVFNVSDQTLPPGESLTDLSLELFDATHQSLALFTSPALFPGDLWTPVFSGPAIAFDVLARIDVSVRFRQQLVTASLQTCAAGDTTDGCIVPYLVAPSEEIDCEAEAGLCTPERGGGALLAYRVPDPQPVPAPSPLAISVTGVIVALLHRRHSRS